MSDVPGLLRTLEELRHRIPFEGRDIVDAYLLATVIADRQRHPDQIAIFFSTDTRAFKRPQVRSLFEQQRVVWRDDFELSHAIAEWNGRFSEPHGEDRF